MRATYLVVLFALLCGCRGLETLRPASGDQAAIRGQITRPDGPGPFPAVVLLHGCGGPGHNAAGWTSLLRGEGFLVLEADQFGPRGIDEVCTVGGWAGIQERYDDTIAAVRIVQARADVRPDRVFLIGFSQGGHLAALLAGDNLVSRWEASPGGPLPAGIIGVYPWCAHVPPRIVRPLLLIAAGADDWVPASVCEMRVQNVSEGSLRPRLVVIPDPHHSFDNPRATGRVHLRHVVNGASPTGFGATISYDAGATRRARDEALSFLRQMP